jgi:hypothetical protein
VALGQAGQAMRLVHFQHIALQHGVVRIALHLDAVVGKHMAVVLDVLAQLGLRCGSSSQGFRRASTSSKRQLLGCVRVVVAQRDVGGLARLTLKLMPTIWARISSSEVVSVSSATRSAAFNPGQPGVEGVPGQDGVIRSAERSADVAGAGSSNRPMFAPLLRGAAGCAARAARRMRPHRRPAPWPGP